MLTGVALLDPGSLSGVANLVLGHGFLKGGLFLVCGIVLLELRNIDELRLHGSGRRKPMLAALWFGGTIGLIGIPYVGVFLGHHLLDSSGSEHGYGWLAVVTMVAGGLSAGAMLRAGCRVFLGWGPAQDDLLTPEPPEEPPENTASVPLLLAVAGVTIALGLASSIVPGLEQRTDLAAKRFVDRAAYTAHVLREVPAHAPARPPFALAVPDRSSVAYGLGTLLVALTAAAFGLWHTELPRALRAGGRWSLAPPVELVRRAHTGVVGDYLLWLAVGTVAIGAVWAATL
jgi:multicomponent Na+:H+ antiporter subunit D